MVAQELEAAETDEQLKKKPGHNNPEAASEFIININTAVDKFADVIHSYEPYKIEDAYSGFVIRYYELLCQVEDYFTNASVEAVLELIDDTKCKMVWMETEFDRQDQKLCPDPRTSSNNILTGHLAMDKLEALPKFKTFKNEEEFAITELFHCLQCAHNVAAETAGHLAFLGHMLQLDQFSFILKHSMHPLLQLQIPPHSCHPEN